MFKYLVMIMGFLYSSVAPSTPPIKPELQLTEADMVRPIPQVAVDLIKRFEGCRLDAYQDSNDIWTIGYGHTKGVHSKMSITQEEAEEFLREDLEEIAPLVVKDVKNMLNNNQYAALLSFVYNVGIGNFQNSTLRKLLDSKDENDESIIVREFMKWDHDHKGNVLAGLQARRRAEASLYFTT